MRNVGRVLVWIAIVSLFWFFAQGCATTKPVVEEPAPCGQSDLPVKEWDR